jgi:hypothetical protein
LKSIIDRFSEVLLACNVPFGRLHGRVTKEKLNLLKKTRRSYKIDVPEFVDFSGLLEPAALLTVARSPCHRLPELSELPKTTELR